MLKAIHFYRSYLSSGFRARCEMKLVCIDERKRPFSKIWNTRRSKYGATIQTVGKDDNTRPLWVHGRVLTRNGEHKKHTVPRPLLFLFKLRFSSALRDGIAVFKPISLLFMG